MMTRKMMLALLLAVIQIVCGCAVFAGAETASEAPETVTVTLKPQVNFDAVISMLQQSGDLSDDALDEDTMNLVKSLAGNLALRLIIGKAEAQADLLLKDTAIGNIAMRTDGDNITIVSDLLDSVALSLNLKELQDEAAGALSADSLKIDPQAVSVLVTGLLGKITAGFEAAYGEVETGSWDLEGAVFTSRKPINMTTKEFLILIMTSLKETLADPQLAEMMAALNYDPASLDKEIESLQNTSDEDLPPFVAYRYTNDAGDVFTSIEMDTLKTDPSSGGNITVTYGTVAGKFIARPGMASPIFTLSAAVNADPQAKTFDLAADYAVNADYARYMSGPSSFSLRTNGAASDTGAAAKFALDLNGVSVFTLDVDVLFGGEITASFDTEGKTVLTAADIERISKDSSSEEATQMQGKLLAAVFRLMGNAAAVMPQEITQLMTIINNAQNPAPAATAEPAGTEGE